MASSSLWITFHKSDSSVFRCTSLKRKSCWWGRRSFLDRGRSLHACRLPNNGVRQYAGVNVGWCSRHTLHHTDHIYNCTQRSLPEFYRGYVDNTFATMKNVPAAEDFLSTLNSCHPSISFTMELASDNKLPFIGMEVLKKGCKLETRYRKPTTTGLLLHHQSHVDKRYKKSLLKTRAYGFNSARFAGQCFRTIIPRAPSFPAIPPSTE